MQSQLSSNMMCDEDEEFTLVSRPIMLDIGNHSGSSSDQDSSDVYCFKQPDLGSACFAMFDELRQSDQLCDVTINVDGQQFKAHRVVLAAAMPYFHGMFTIDMIEAKLDQLTIHTVTADAFKSLLDFAYTGQINITHSNVQSLLVGASYLQLEAVATACCNYLKEKLNANNVLGVKTFADTLSCTNLVQEAQKFIQKHFPVVAKSDEFLALSFEEVMEIVSKDELNIIGEEQVFETAMRWIKKDISREIHLPDILAQVRLPLLTPEYLADKVMAEEKIKNNLQCRDLIDEAKDYHLMPERRTLLQSNRTRPRSVIYGLIYAVGGLAKSGDSLSTVEVFDPSKGTWTLAEAMTMLRSRVGVAVMGSKLYAIGGYNGTDRLSTVEVFDPAERKWTKIASMVRKRSAVGAATLSFNKTHQLYVCGGYDGISSLNTVECYYSDRDVWTPIASMSKHRSAAGVVAFEGKMYALGGHDGLSIFDSVEVYDPITERWTTSTPMLTKRCRLGVAALKGRIYVCGGYDGSTFLQTAEVYDPITKQWQYIAPMNVMRSRVALVANCGKLFAIGGYDGASNLSTVEMYDIDTDSWCFVASMGAHEGGVGVGVIPKTCELCNAAN